MRVVPTVSANVTAEEKADLEALSFIQHKSVRELGGDAIRMLLKKHAHAIGAAKRMRKLLPEEKR